MGKKYFLFITIIILLVRVNVSATAQTVSFKGKSYPMDRDSLWIKLIKHSVSFVDDNAFDEDLGTYFSEIGSTGEIISDKIHVLALSRMIYALAVASDYYPEYLPKAVMAAEFIRNKMVMEDGIGKYFLPTISKSKGPEIVTELPIYEQTYGLCGLIALYQKTKDPELGRFIEEMFHAIDKRYRDNLHGGYFEIYEMNIKTRRKKSYSSTVYVATSALVGLYETMPDEPVFRERLGELINLVSENFWDQEMGWIIEEFTDDWQPGWTEKQRGDFTLTEVGHNTQIAWLLLRASQWDFIDEQQKDRYRLLAKEMLERLLTKSIIDEKNGGVYGQFARESNQEIGDGLKAWWQQAETILAYQMAVKSGVLSGSNYEQLVASLTTYFFSFFIDPKNGGEYFNVSETGLPIPKEPKGNKGKSAYHTTELAWYMMLYSQ